MLDVQPFLSHEANSVRRDMHGFVLHDSVDFLEFFLFERAKDDARWWRRTAPVHHDSSTGHPGARVGPNVAMNDDQAVFHAAADTGAGSTADKQVSPGHLCSSIVAAPVQNGEGATGHAIAREVASHAFARDRRPLIGGPEEPPSIALKGEGSTCSKRCNPRAQDAQRPKASTFR